MGSSVFSFNRHNLINDTLSINTECIKAIDSSDAKDIDISLIDDSNEKYPAKLWKEYNSITGLKAWLSTRNITSIDSIILEVPENASRNIIIKAKTDTHALMTGLYIGKYNRAIGADREKEGSPFYLNVDRMRTHAFICGMTGSGKTFLTKAIIEEMLKNEVPVVAIDLKGDLASLGIIPEILTPDELAFFCTDVNYDKSVSYAKAIDVKLESRRKLGDFSLSEKEINQYANSIDFKILTPKANYGNPLSLANQLSAPLNAQEIRKNDPDQFAAICAAVTDAFLDRLYPNTTRGTYENERSFMHELINWCWKNDIEIKGEEGLKRIQDYITSPPFDEIGGLSIAEFLDKGGRRTRLLMKIANQLAEPERQWNIGEPLTAQMLIEKRNGKTPLTVISVSHLNTFEDRAFVVAQVSYALTSWMLTQSESAKPRVMLAIDEIGAQGGPTSLFPSYPKEPPSKRFLSQIIRQGRSFGVAALLATQNPSDIDYKALSNCGIWIVGSLMTARDRANILQGMGVDEIKRGLIQGWITGADVGKFVLRDIKEKSPVMIQSRWLYSYHKGLDQQQIIKLREIWESKKNNIR